MLGELQNGRGDKEGNNGCASDAGDHANIGVAGCCAEDGDDGAGGCGGAQASAADGFNKHGGHAAADRGQNEGRLHQHVREVDFVDTTEEVDDRCTWCGGPCAAATKESVGQKNTKTRSGVGFQQVEDRFSGFHCLVGG